MSIESAIEAMEKEVIGHTAVRELDRFGATLKARPLEYGELGTVLAITAAFFREVPGGILALGLRLTDAWMARSGLDAVTKGAEVLYSAVDEFGLYDLAKGVQRSHHGYFRDMIESWGYDKSQIYSVDLILKEGKSLGLLNNAFYRHRPIPQSLGFHFASEVTFNREFILCYEGLKSNIENYKFLKYKSNALDFYYMHTEVEPMHRQTSIDAIVSYMNEFSGNADQIMAGALAFLEGYSALFSGLNAYLSGEYEVDYINNEAKVGSALRDDIPAI